MENNLLRTELAHLQRQLNEANKAKAQSSYPSGSTKNTAAILSKEKETEKEIEAEKETEKETEPEKETEKK